MDWNKYIYFFLKHLNCALVLEYGSGTVFPSTDLPAGG